MVVRIGWSKSVSKLIHYHESKRQESCAILIAYQGFAKGAEQLSPAQLRRRFQLRISLNRKTKTNALHISLNFAPEEQLSKERLGEISKVYLEKIGFENQPCLIYQHLDAGHPHVHLVTVLIDREGKRIDTYPILRNQSEKARKEIEQVFGLVVTKNQNRIGPSIQELGKLVYGKETTKSSIQTVLSHVLDKYTFTSFDAYNAILSGFGVQAFRGEPGSKQYRWGGLVYHLLDEKGKRKGMPIKASRFNFQPTLKNLNRRFYQDLQKQQELAGLVEERISEILPKSISLSDFQAQLKKSGIILVFNRRKTGQVDGVTLVDHLHRVGIKSADLGKGFRVGSLLERFGSRSKTFTQAPSQKETTSWADSLDQAATGLGIDPIPDMSVALSNSPERDSIRSDGKKKKAKRKQKISN
ncbi:relaxase/mobilization nuclease domain-containing protein [Algoriphagus sp.]|uniref:relaxase/mobilization nuclease domain-containing protein n=1 Tax=Algoriphagus sp. TaxID=1872435 RepID=UPI00260E8FAC|nr:relaxase/mobilization nuclease domain-containing protein [Algoriphagus sp.]